MKTLKQEIAKVLSKYYPYSKDELYTELRQRNNIQLVIDGIDNSLKHNISLKEACDLLREELYWRWLHEK